MIKHVKDDNLSLFRISDQNDSEDDYEKIGNQSGQIDQKLRAGLCQVSFLFVEIALNYQEVESFVA